MKRVNIADLFNIDEYERREGNKYKAVVLIGRFARYLIRKSEKEKTSLEDEPVVIAANKFISEGIPYTEVEGED
ncbi:MAG: hypothetical protein ABIL16_02460 [candidate division WOR-3 bacterium]